MKKLQIIYLAIVLIVIFGILIIALLQKMPIEYEYYKFNGEKGYSNNCVNDDAIMCEINGKMVEVQQYAE